MKRVNRGEAELDDKGQEIKDVSDKEESQDEEIDSRKRRRMEREKKMKALTLGSPIKSYLFHFLIHLKHICSYIHISYCTIHFKLLF